MYDKCVTNIQTPETIVHYCQGLLQAPWRFSVLFLSELLGVSHDRIARSLIKTYSWKKLLLSQLTLSDGYLIVDETDIDKSFSKVIHGAGWIFSHRKSKHIFGLHIVVLVWTNKIMTIPIAWKIYKKGGGKTKIDLAQELIVYALLVLRLSPRAVLFDSLYASEPLLKFLIKHKQSFYTQLPKNRLLDKQAVKKVNNGRPYWTRVGMIKGSIRVQIVRNRRKYYMTNDIGISRKEQLQTYKVRWAIEEVFRYVKQEFGFEKCQARSLRVQNNHIGSCFFLYTVLQDIAEKTQMTMYCVKRKVILDPHFSSQIDLSAYMRSA